MIGSEIEFGELDFKEEGVLRGSNSFLKLGGDGLKLNRDDGEDGLKWNGNDGEDLSFVIFWDDVVYIIVICEDKDSKVIFGDNLGGGKF